MGREKKAYKFRFYPNAGQEVLLAKTFGCVRVVYNKCLAFREEAYKAGEKVGYGECSKHLTALKSLEEYSWLNEVSSVCLQQAVRHLDTAYKNFFKKLSNKPRFKRRSNKQSVHLTKAAFRVKNEEVYMAKSKEPLKIKWSRKFQGEPSSVVVSKDPSGRYFITFLLEEDVKPLPRTDKEVGIDLGIRSLITCSDRTKVVPLKGLESNLNRLATLQKRLSKKKIGSRNRDKARVKVAKLHAKISDKRRDFLHKLSTKLINENQVIYLEDLEVNSLKSNRLLNRLLQQCSLARLVELVTYKANRYGRAVHKVDHYFPSSKTCSNCKNINHNLKLSEKSWTCSFCNTTHDRDINAAINIKTAGQAGFAFGGVSLEALVN